MRREQTRGEGRQNRAEHYRRHEKNQGEEIRDEMSGKVRRGENIRRGGERRRKLLIIHSFW